MGLTSHEATPGEFARRWLRDLALRHDGFSGLSRTAGFSADWAREAARGALPNRRALEKLFVVAGASGELRDRVSSDVAAFRRHSMAHLTRRVNCRVCHKSVQLSNASRSSSFDATTAQFVCRQCGSDLRRQVVCPDCGVGRERSKRLSSKGVHRGKSGRLLLRCQSCSRKRAVAKARTVLLEHIITERARVIAHNGAETEGDKLLLALLSESKTKLNNAPFILERKDPATTEALRALRWEDFLRKKGRGNLSDGLRAHDELLREGLVSTRKRSLSYEGRTRLAVSIVASGRIRGVFGLCPLCRLISYRKASRASVAPHIWHNACLRAWRKSRKFVDWLTEVRAAIRSGVQKDLLPDAPLPDAGPTLGAPVTSDDLAAAYRVLMARMGGKTRTQIAVAEGIAESTINSRIDTLRQRLPNSWTIVFGGRSRANETRQRLYPLPRTEAEATGSRRKAAARMVSFRIAGDVIKQVTGVDLAAE